MKKRLKFLSLAIVFASAVSFAFTKGLIVDEMSDFALENVEALSGGDTSTSWNCLGQKNKCYRKCGTCGTIVKGTGNMTGSHSCSFM